jgi:molybdopterin adenylyltransferase
MKIGRITISDRASAGVYEDLGGPEIERVLRAEFPEAEFESAIVPDDKGMIEAALKEMADALRLDLIVTTGGTGITARDVTPEATRAVLEKELPGFAEAMRMASFVRVKTAILSRAMAGIRGKTMILNLPGKPSAIRECLPVIAPAIREGVAHLNGEDPHAPDHKTADTPRF